MTYNVFSGTLNPTHFTSLRRRGLKISMAAYGTEGLRWITAASDSGFWDQRTCRLR